MTGDSARILTSAEFFDEVVAVTRQRTASMYLYLNLEAAGQIWVQWEQPGVDHPRRYRVADPDGLPYPHCTIIEGVVRLAPVLPLDPMRTARVKAFKTSSHVGPVRRCTPPGSCLRATSGQPARRYRMLR